MRMAALKLALVASFAALPAQAQTTDDFFDPGALQEIRLNVNRRDLSLLREDYVENTYYTADFTWRNVRVRNVGIRSRGVASRSSSKLALRVDFNRFASGQDFLGLKSLVLDNLWQDGSMLHEALSMAFFARMGQAAPRTSFARLYINNEYQGLYAIVESVDKSFLTRTTRENEGYLFSYQLQQQPFYGESFEELEQYKARFEPQTHEREADSTLYGPIQALFREVNEPLDAVWRDRVERYIDLPQFVTQVAIESFLAESDGLIGVTGMNNFYVYRPGGSDKHRFFPWDKDNAFLLAEFGVQERFEDNVLLRQALQYDDLRDLFFETLRRACDLSTEENWLDNEIVRLAALVESAVTEDSRKPFTTEAFFESIDVLRDFARRRPAIVREQIARKLMAR